MALSNSERQKRWLEKNRALHNFRRRKKGGDVSCQLTSQLETNPIGSSAAPTVQPTSAAKSKVEELRELVRVEQERVVEEPVHLLVYRNDFGGVITKTQWEKLQEKKRLAKEGGYTLDEYSQ